MLNKCPGPPAATRLDLDAIEDEIADLDAKINAATHRQLELIRQVDASGRWADRGAKSCAHWLSWRIGIDLGTAREKVRVARALRELPTIDKELETAQLSYSQVRAMTRVASPENEERLVELALVATAAQLERIVRGVRRAEASEGPGHVRLERWVRDRATGDGTVRIEAQLSADEAAIVMEALRTTRAAMAAETGASEAGASETDVPGAKPGLADALVRMAEEVEAVRSDGAVAEVTRTGGERTSVVAHLGPDVFGEGLAARLEDGSSVSAETFRRLACDCSLIGVREDAEGKVLDVGRKTRSVPPAVRRAVVLRDQGCVFPGCTHRRFVDCHHVRHWAHGGETKKDNLVLLCTFHHQRVHEGGFQVMFDGTAAPRFLGPSGEALPAIWPRSGGGASSRGHGGSWLERLCSEHPEGAVACDDLQRNRWYTESVDYAACVDAVLATSSAGRAPALGAGG